MNRTISWQCLTPVTTTTRKCTTFDLFTKRLIDPFFFLQNAFPILYHIGSLNYFKNTEWIVIHAKKLSWCFIFMGGCLKATISQNSSFENIFTKRSYEDIGAWSLEILCLSYTSSIKGCQLLFNVAFHQMSSSIKVYLFLKIVFHLGLSSIKDHIPLKTVFSQGLSSSIYGIINPRR